MFNIALMPAPKTTPEPAKPTLMEEMEGTAKPGGRGTKKAVAN